METNSTNTTTHDIAVGDCFVCTWGYDQTNAEYFRVDRITPKSVEVTAIGAIVVEEHDGGTTLAPDPHTERDWTVLFDHGNTRRNSKLCRVKRTTWRVDDNSPYIILGKNYRAYPVTGFTYDNSKIGR